MSSPIPNGLPGKPSLLPDSIGHFRQIAFVETNSRQVLQLPHDVERSQSFPNLFGAGINSCEFRAGRDFHTWSDGERANTPADGRAHFRNLLAALQFCYEPTLMDGGSDVVGVDDAPSDGGDNPDRLQQRDDLRAASGIAKANQGKSGVTLHHPRRIAEHS